MKKQLPELHPNSILENISVRYFQSKLPPDWLVQKPQHDFGRDLIIEIVVDGQAIGNEIVIQLKSSNEPSNNPDYETVILKVSTYNYLMSDVRVVLIVKYIDQDNEAYWVYLRDCHPPKNPKQETFSLPIPRTNRLSEINWKDVVVRVTNIYHEKLQSANGL